MSGVLSSLNELFPLNFVSVISAVKSHREFLIFLIPQIRICSSVQMEASISFLGLTKTKLSFLVPSSNVLNRRLRRDFPVPALKLKKGLVLPRISHRSCLIRAQSSDGLGAEEDDGFVLEDVPHLTKFLPDLPVKLSLLFDSSLFLSPGA